MSQKSSGTKHRGARQLRERKQKKLYSEDWALGDDDELDGGRRTFSLQEKLEEPGFEAHGVVREMRGEELTVAHMQRYGFSTPLLFKDKAGLGIRVPSSDFTINDVRVSVGSRRLLDVMDVSTQKNQEMTMKDWQKYYEDPNKDKLLNVISLEFSHTKLENYVQSPTIVRQIDWVDNVWPRHLKEQQTESTNLLEDMKYPKVQKYCLMSVKGCYTDFHIDFGGTSVWYHILKGCKVFWLIPPTEHNIDLYERWCLSGKQSDIFFGDTVEKCARIFLQEGNTFFIPTGWIHAVYTPLDSLVFGGNFLHSFGIEKQLKIAQVEDTTKVPHKYRYPFFTEMLWYVLERYVHCLLGNSHLASGEDAPIPPERQHIHLTQGELHGLKEIVKYLHMLPSHRKNLPELIRDPIALIQDVRTLIGLHRQDSRELAISGKSVLSLPEDQNGKKPSGIRGPYQKSQNIDKLNHDKPPKPHNNFKGPKTSPGSVSGDKGGGPRRRRTRCKKCSACMRSDCGECSFCLDMVKFGGPGRAKQTCNMRQCLQPMLPVTAACARCGLDGWMQTPVALLQKGSIRCDGPSNLMECSVCYEIAHPACVQRLCTEFTGYINEDMPNSWECPLCCKLGKNTDYRPRHFRARQKSSEIMRRTSISSDASSAFEQKIHQETDSENENETKEYTELLPIKKRRSSESSEIDTKVTPPPNVNDTRKTALRMQLAQQIASNSTKQLKKPMVVVRPAPLVPANPPVPSNNLAMDKRVILKVFRYLTPADLLISALVCKTWSTYSIDPSLWKYMIFDRKRISSDMLKGIVRRQPESLSLNWCRINHFQLPWLIQRLNNLKQLFLQSLDVKTAISLRTNHSAILNVLDLSFITDFNDSALREILGSTNDARAGLTNDKIRFRNLKSLLIAGTDVTDITLRYVTQYCPNLQHLSLSMCPRISDAGIAQISTKPATTVTNLISLDLSHTKMVTETSLEHLARCEKLTRLDCRHALNITTQALIKFAAKSKHDLQVREIKLVDIRQK